MQPTGELNQRGRVQRLKEGAVHASEVDRGVLAHRLHSESDQRPRRYPDHPLWVTSPQFGQGEVNGYDLTDVYLNGGQSAPLTWCLNCKTDRQLAASTHELGELDTFAHTFNGCCLRFTEADWSF